MRRGNHNNPGRYAATEIRKLNNKSCDADIALCTAVVVASYINFHAKIGAIAERLCGSQFLEWNTWSIQQIQQLNSTLPYSWPYRLFKVIISGITGGINNGRRWWFAGQEMGGSRCIPRIQTKTSNVIYLPKTAITRTNDSDAEHLSCHQFAEIDLETRPSRTSHNELIE